jgi:hypothetical protein
MPPTARIIGSACLPSHKIARHARLARNLICSNGNSHDRRVDGFRPAVSSRLRRSLRSPDFLPFLRGAGLVLFVLEVTVTQTALGQSAIGLSPPSPGEPYRISTSTLAHPERNWQFGLSTPVRLRLNESRERTPDQRWLGLGIGAGVGAIVFGIIGHRTCDEDGSCIGPTLGIGLLGAVVDGVTGGLLGSLIPKHEDRAD